MQLIEFTAGESVDKIAYTHRSRSSITFIITAPNRKRGMGWEGVFPLGSGKIESLWHPRVIEDNKPTSSLWTTA